ncbi:hypothetical protein EDB19DRAFT_741558 [Suillus lakei]|nr:hypothetical protein EDB19DRAFT_741558 [Suillus lakei]
MVIYWLIFRTRDERVAIESVYRPRTNLNILGKFQEYKYGVPSHIFPSPVQRSFTLFHAYQHILTIFTSLTIMISTATTITARVAVTGFLSVSCFKRAVVDNTIQVLSKAEKASAGLAVYSVCMSTITLVLAADKAAQRFLNNESKRMPAAPGDDDDDCNPSANDTAASATPQPVAPFHLQPSLSPSLSRLIESTESPSANDNTTSATSKPVEPSNLQPSPPPSSLRLIESTERISAPMSTYDASDTDDCESFDDESTVHEDDRSEPQPRKGHALERTTLDYLIARMNALTLDDPYRPSKLRPLILVTNRNTTSISIPYPPLPEPAYPMDALSIQALSLGDRPSSTSKLKPLLLVTKRDTRHFKLPPPATTLLRQPKTKTTARSQTYWPFSLNPTIWAHPQPN